MRERRDSEACLDTRDAGSNSTLGFTKLSIFRIILGENVISLLTLFFNIISSPPFLELDSKDFVSAHPPNVCVRASIQVNTFRDFNEKPSLNRRDKLIERSAFIPSYTIVRSV